MTDPRSTSAAIDALAGDASGTAIIMCGLPSG